MMHIGPSDAARLSLWEYTALLHAWNAAHERETDEVEPPDLDKVKRHMAALAGSSISQARH